MLYKSLDRISAIFVLIFSCSFIFVQKDIRVLYITVPMLFWAMVFTGLFGGDIEGKRLRLCRHGLYLLYIFLFSAPMSVLYHGLLALYCLPGDHRTFIYSAIFSFITEIAVFWVGIVYIYSTSLQLGIKQRIICALLASVPVVNIFVLANILVTVHDEIKFETEKLRLDKLRAPLKVCQTKYPILLVHGIFFRDFRYVNYWGRIPAALEKNGATVYYGDHSSACSIAEGAGQISKRIEKIISETACEKVNIIAHSKGGLDSRYAIEFFGQQKNVASLTTVNSPHKGCLFVDYLLEKLPKNAVNEIAKTYNKALNKLGEKDSDFMAAVTDMRQAHCMELNEKMRQPDGVFCQSVGSVMKTAKKGKFPMNFCFSIAERFGGKNDGIVAESSFPWGDKYTLIETQGKRGISHGDMIDLNRENIPGFDVREFYVTLVSDLKRRGL